MAGTTSGGGDGPTTTNETSKPSVQGAAPSSSAAGGASEAGNCLGPYKLGSTLGVGTFGKVKVAVHQGTGLRVAIKIINKAKMANIDMTEKTKREISILQSLRHPHVMRLYELVDSPTDIFMVTEFLSGGELFDYIVQHSRLHESEARRFFQQIVTAVDYCHSHAVCHRDLKPENILLDFNLNVKVGDFGLSNFIRDGDFLRTSCGSPNYASPEVVSGRAYAGPEVDVWSCAVILYALLCGSLPFDDENVPNLFKKIKHGHFTLPGHLSEGARSLIVRMLTVDPVKRITIKEIRRHPWFRVSLPPYLSSVTCLRATMSGGIDLDIFDSMRKMGYNVDLLASELPAMTVPGIPPSREAVAYQLLVDQKATHDVNRTLPAPFAFSRAAQKRTAAASLVIGGDVSPFTWSNNSTIFGMHLTGANLSSPHIFDPQTSGTPCVPFSPATMKYSGGPGAGDGFVEWSPGGPMWSAARWKLGIESSLESIIIVTAILNTLKALSYEWCLVTPYKIRCRPVSGKTGADVPEAASENTSKITAGTASIDVSALKSQRSDPRLNNQRLTSDNLAAVKDRSRGSLIICIQIFKIAPARYLIDVQLFDGSSLVGLSEALWLTSAIYSALTQVKHVGDNY